MSSATPQAAFVRHVAPEAAATSGIALRFPAADDAPVASDVWSVAGWRIQFVRLGARQSFALPAGAVRSFIKVIAGELAEPIARPFPPIGAVCSTRFDGASLQAGADGAWVAILGETASVPANLHSMSELAFRGPLAERLEWEPFSKRFAGLTNYFDGADAHIATGFHLFDERSRKLAYVHFWTAGKGVDLSTHDHGNPPTADAPTFAEVHWVFNNGTGRGAMYSCEAPRAPERERLPISRGCEHGPFFRLDAAGRPRRRENGAVDYPWHGWQAGTDASGGQAYDFVGAFEINPDFVCIATS